MNKYMNISIAFVVSSFLAINFYLLFGEKSVIPKSVYVKTFERMTLGDFREEMSKEALISPEETYTVYAGSEDEVESWVVSEGDAVNVGDELALLNTERVDSEQELLLAKHNSLLQQETDVKSMLADLMTAQSGAESTNSSAVDRQENVTEVDGETTIKLGLGINFEIDVTQEGSYAQAIAAVEQQLSEINQSIVVTAAELAQNPARPALVSPVEGIVSNVTRNGSKLAVDILSPEKLAVTYAKDNEWQDIEEGDSVLLQGNGLDEAKEGYVLSVSEIPVKENEVSEAYKTLDADKATNPLAYYEVQMITENELQSVPYGNNINAVIVTNEAKDAVSLKEEWLRRSEEELGKATIINGSGKAVEVTVTTPFVSNTRAVVTEGLTLGQIVVPSSRLSYYEEPTSVFLPMPSYMPKKAEWRSYSWKDYLEYILVK
ncbi:efflux RND transporter periplasmic adaptor subunit [Sporosarcina sp. G11-34]|uniref:efflux RND transporter periplasmic adaptor subunit n=1 Tax=Sporosarcina sp. G11-34 TaxID=2849605 RepID=UPI0022A9C701|nr:efflux RND transporter periplasmic adaptor subunit [Sporosarcina sp. G11-34]MCZ2258678.1 efflux RND transporter periplasmic adaptor subunit [Sporosarcina sp. G11-34]